MRRGLLIGAFLGASLSLLAQYTPIPWHPKAGPPAPQKAAPAAAVQPGQPPLPPKYQMTFDRVTTLAPGVYVAEGNVRFAYQDMLLTADAVTYDSEKGTLWATGQVSVDWQDFTLAGTELHYDLNAGTGHMRDAYGVQKTGDFTVIGGVIKKTGEDWFEVLDGTFTSCTAAVDPWAIRVSRARFHVDHYAFLTNPRFHVRGAPLLYLPYLVWPIKPDRATGLLIPEVGNSSQQGFSVNTSLFIAPQEWWDDTVYLDYFRDEGFGLGNEFRYVPSEKSYGWLRGYYIQQKSDDERRWYGAWTHLQNFRKGWYAVADVTLLSDIDFLRDYQRDYTQSTISGTDSRIYLVRNWGPYFFTAKVEERKQYFTQDADLNERTLPGVELRSSLQPLGHGIYGGFNTSADAFHKEWAEYAPEPLKSSLSYYRLDLHPFVQWPLHPAPWLDLTPRLEARATYYSESLGETDDAYDGGDLLRTYVRGSLELSGPRFFKKYKGGSKHVLEPFITYTYVSPDQDAGRVPLFDEVDQIPVDVSLIRYGFRNRIYAKKGRLEMDSELYQDQSFRGDLSVNGDQSSPYSPVFFVARFWPSRTWSGELRLRYSILTDRIDSQSFSLQYKPRKGESEDYVRITYLKTGQTTVSAISDYTGGPASEEIRLAGSFRIGHERLTITPILERDLKNDIWRNRRLILWYHGTCYAVGIEAGKRTIGDFHDTTYRFLIRLKGAGTVVDFYGGTGTYVQ